VFLKVNGESIDVPAGLTIDALLSHLGITREYTAVAVNREITPKGEYATVTLKDGDKIEIVRPMGGG
jgi:sulfur carrier protein